VKAHYEDYKNISGSTPNHLTQTEIEVLY